MSVDFFFPKERHSDEIWKRKKYYEIEKRNEKNKIK